MEMEIKKMKMSSELGDRLSELPDSLILNIFEFLPMNDIVRTQILSRRWENLWTVTPYLNFDNKSENLDDFRNFVNRCLLSWRGGKIQKFTISSETLNKSLLSDMDLWLRLAVDNGVQVLHSKVFGFDLHKYDYRVPKCLYSCSSLQDLWFMGSILSEINGNGVQWNQLKNLNICQRFGLTQHAIELVLSKCPVLEVLKLSFGDKDDNLRLSFRSTSLKVLMVQKAKHFPASISMDTELRICTPNLEQLVILGVTYGECSLMDVSSLTHATLCFSENDHVGVTLSQILPTIGHVKGLTLSNSGTKVLGVMTSNSLLSPFPSVVFLNLSGSFVEHEQIVGVLEIFPKLKTLVIQDQESKDVDPKSKNNFEPTPSESFLAELKTVEVTWNVCDFSIFRLIKILLKYSSKLEKMVFRVNRAGPPSGSSDLLLLARKELLRMPRSSPTAELLIFCKI